MRRQFNPELVQLFLSVLCVVMEYARPHTANNTQKKENEKKHSEKGEGGFSILSGWRLAQDSTFLQLDGEPAESTRELVGTNSEKATPLISHHEEDTPLLVIRMLRLWFRQGLQVIPVLAEHGIVVSRQPSNLASSPERVVCGTS